MSKEAPYFSHDCNARTDEKIIALRIKYNWDGYGLFWALIEKLRESADYTSVRDYNIIAYDLRTDTAKIKSIVEDFGLFTFTEDGKRFYSESLNRRMKIKDHKSEQAREKALKRWGKTKEKDEKEEPQEYNSNAIVMQQQCSSNANKIKESKVKEKKEKDEKEKFSSATTQQILLSKKISLDQWAMMFKISPERIKECVKEFAEFKERHGENSQWTSESDMTKNFEFWLRSNAQPKEIKKPAKTENSTPRNIFRNKTN